MGVVRSLGPRILGFEGRYVSYSTYVRLRGNLRGCRFRSLDGLCERRRQRKDPGEIRSIRRSIKVLEAGLEGILSLIKPGTRERDIALELEASLKKMGAEAVGFDTIVASGWRSSLPHGKASNKKIRKGEFVIIDCGAVVDGYHSDKTRTFVVGRATKRQREVYSVVKIAHDLVIDGIKPGLRCADVDRIARDYIKKEGLGRYFDHGTGHGVGLKIHEGPVIGPASRDILEPGMVVTVEPGVYLPGWGGVRIEDMVVVTERGCRVLTEPSAELTSL